MALFASIVGGVAGYGTGALMPLVLVPMIGAEPVVPIIAISAMFTNTGRFVGLFPPRRRPPRADRDRRGRAADRARRLWLHAAHRAGAAFVIGAMLILTVPLRWLLKRRDAGSAVTGWRRRRRLRHRDGRHRRRRRDPALDPDGGGSRARPWSPPTP